MNSLDYATSIGDLRKIAQKKLPWPIFNFIDGAAFSEITLRKNVDDFGKFTFRQRIAQDISTRKLDVTILGQKASLPVAISPTGISGITPGGTQGELMAARAARSKDIPYTLGMLSIMSIEALKQEVDSFWFQICMLRDRELMAAMIKRAHKAGCPVLILTMTWPITSELCRLMQHPSAAMPPSFNLRTILTYATAPRWSLKTLFGGPLRFGNFDAHSQKPTELISVIEQLDPSATWDDVRWVRDQWPGKLVIKGVMDPEDAMTSVAIGADAVSVSNHGGNQLDGASSTIAALPAVVAAVNGRAEVLLDGGVRSGQDVLKAMALGAKACLLGRAHLYGLAAGGEEGVKKAISIIERGIDVTAGLTGLTDLSQVNRDILLNP